MNYTKRIACLACSRKFGGYCVAGREILSNGYGEWIRPVSARSGAEISAWERKYQGGRIAQALDVIDVPLIEPRPKLYQTENHLIDAGSPWTKVGKLSWSDLAGLVEAPSMLWLNGYSSGNGVNDRVPDAEVSGMTNSLVLIKPLSTTVEVLPAGLRRTKKSVRANFMYNGSTYNLGVTDGEAEQIFRARGVAEHPIGQDLYLCISLGEIFEGFGYKLVASIFSENPL